MNIEIRSIDSCELVVSWLNPGLKKQSQFLKGQIDITSYLKGGYGNNCPVGGEKNKPNSKLALSIAEWANYI